MDSQCSIANAIGAQKIQKNLCGSQVRNRTREFAVVETVLFATAMTCALLRAAGRGKWFRGAGYGWDDVVLFVCCRPMTGLTVTGYMEQANGLGKDTWELPTGKIQNSLMLFHIGNTFYSLIIFGTQIAMLLLYLRVWKDDAIFRRVCQIMIAMLLIAMIGFEFSRVFLCSPTEYARKAIVGAKGQCIYREVQLYTDSASNIAFDVVILLLPISKIINLNMSLTKKLGLMFAFLVGLAVPASSPAQLYYLITKVSTTQNPTWNYFDIVVWRVTEIYLSINCCCTPIIAGLLNRMIKKASQVISSPSEVRETWDKRRASSSRSRSVNKNGGTGTVSLGRRDKSGAVQEECSASERIELRSNVGAHSAN